MTTKKKMLTRTSRLGLPILAVAALLPLSACSDVLDLDVEAPGRILDSDLNNREAIPGLVNGMSFDLAQAVDGSLQSISLASGDIWHGGSYDFGTYATGNLQDAPEDWDGEWGTMHQARWVAESGLRRIADDILTPEEFEQDANVARAYVLGGFANRWIGEQQCVTSIDGGPEVAHTDHFVRADSMFTRAIEVAGAAGRTDLVNAALGGRASARAWLGDWDAAEADAAQVPADFQFDVIFSTAVGAVSNDFVFETNSRSEFSVFSSIWEDVSDDPRVPWEIPRDANGAILKGQDGETDFFRQLKNLTEDADIALTKGTEMLVLRAEARLRAGDLAGMTDLLNQARAEYEMDSLNPPGSVAEAWPVMRFERAATLWIEGRRLNDLRRWKDEGGVAAEPFAADRDTCFPISDEERRTNSNLVP
ncbi:MAG: RagB/SusD family nutrient uptake outer membrane protein [Longimicrobiales bacterium]